MESSPSEYVAREPWFTVRHECVELPGGAHVPDYYVFEYPAWVNVIAITRDGLFVMIDQYRHGLGRTDYELAAGVCDPDDASPLEAARRELLEETGFGGGRWRETMRICANPPHTTTSPTASSPPAWNASRRSISKPRRT